MFIEYPTNRATARITTFFSTMTHICVMRGAMRSIHVADSGAYGGRGPCDRREVEDLDECRPLASEVVQALEHEVDALHRLNGDFPVEDNPGLDDVDARQQRVALLGRHVRAVRPRFYRDHRIIRQYVKFLTVELVLPPRLPRFDMRAPRSERAMRSC